MKLLSLKNSFHICRFRAMQSSTSSSSLVLVILEFPPVWVSTSATGTFLFLAALMIFTDRFKSSLSLFSVNYEIANKTILRKIKSIKNSDLSNYYHLSAHGDLSEAPGLY